VADRAEVDEAVARVAERFGRIDVVIANAGIGHPGTLATIDEAHYRRVVAVNLDGTWNTVRATLPSLLESRGYLLLISSAYAFMNGVGMGAYPFTKAAVEAMGRALRAELTSQDVAVGVAYFGFIDTDLVRNAFADPGVQEMARAIPGFLTKPIPVARASAAIVAGVERRAARVTAPGWMRPALALRGLLAMADGRFSRDRHIQRAVEMLRDPRSG
jgi:NAD(P)-dependent dehydrogenase (short-subunit alcohol dehydrogenase family)